MRTTIIGLLLCLSFATQALAAPRIIETNDPAGDPMRNAIRQFLTDLADGNERRVREQFAGDDAAKSLLDRYLKAVAASQAFRAAAQKRFGESTPLAQAGVDDEIRRYVRAIPVETIIVDGNTASMSPGSGFLLGVDLTQVNGAWKISSPTALHGDNEAKLTRKLDVMIANLPALTTEIESGKLATEDAAMQAARDRIGSALRAIEGRTPAPATRRAAITRPTTPR